LTGIQYFINFILNIKEKYPKAFIILTTTPMLHSKKWDEAIEEICFQIKDDTIRQFLYHNNGVGTPGHLRISESEEMAKELQRILKIHVIIKKVSLIRETSVCLFFFFITNNNWL
jgi:hypothetical protein